MPMSRVLGRWFALLLFALVGVAILPAVALVLWAVTWGGKLVGVSILALLALPLFFARWIVAPTPRAARAMVLLTGVGAIALLAAAAVAPPGRSSPGARITSHSAVEPASWLRTLLRPVPEIDQVAIGTHLVPFLDPIIDRAAARRIAALTMPIYLEMEADPGVRDLGSVLPDAYADLFGYTDDRGHLYQVLPGPTSTATSTANATSTATEALIFLHGSAGNFKSYAWVLAELAESRRMVIVCPSFGFGNWGRPGGLEAVERARNYVVQQLGIDPSRIYLAGLSNGGVGVSLAAAHHPDWYRGLVLISPVMESSALRSERFVEGWRGRSVLILEGASDDRVEEPYVTGTVRQLKRAGIRVRYELVPGEDHFLFFSRRTQSIATIAEWMGALGGRSSLQPSGLGPGPDPE
ncbi:MAG: prolyl oligopeptidase family serine peptidase [Deltaproteobacteria bacterium]|nr:prolyl oligopeptidase family serine peptidase [Deltaproteobacteria bacterium]